MVAEDKVLTSFGADMSGERALICIPHAGGGAATFAAWARPLRSTATVWAARLPGRESLIREEPLQTVEQMAEILARALERLPASELTLFGYCSGALIAYELAHRLTAGGDERVKRLVVGSRLAPAPDGASQSPQSEITRTETLSFLRRMGGTDSEILNNPEYVSLIAPALISDAAAALRYRPPASRDKYSIPIVAIGGMLDVNVREADLMTWKACTSGSFSIHQFAGDHFFLITQLEEVIEFFVGLMR